MNTLSAILLLSFGLCFAQSMDYRTLGQFKDMIICANPTSWPILDNTDYGCYCGKGSSGTPVDDLDRCCEVHDRCYSDAIKHPQCWTIGDDPYSAKYTFTCNIPRETITCPVNKNDQCQHFICECDRKAAECFATTTYNPENEHLPSSQCK